MGKKAYIKDLEAQNDVLVEANAEKLIYIEELEQSKATLTSNLALALSLTIKSDEPTYGEPENPVILNDVINSLIAQNVIAMDENGEQMCIHDLAILNSLKI